MSATPNEYALRKFYPNIEIKEVPALEHEGKLLHYWKYPCSKQFFEKNDFKDFVKKVILPKTGHNPIITYNEYDTQDNRKDLGVVEHFYNTEGKNDWQSKPLVIIGVPHQALQAYLLQAVSFGIDLHGKKLMPVWKQWEWTSPRLHI